MITTDDFMPHLLSVYARQNLVPVADGHGKACPASDFLQSKWIGVDSDRLA
jgi:hypothetical protein